MELNTERLMDETSAPSFEEELAVLSLLFSKTVDKLVQSLKGIDILDLDESKMIALINELDGDLTRLIQKSDEWTEEVIPAVIAVGVASFLLPNGYLKSAKLEDLLQTIEGSEIQRALRNQLTVRAKNDFRKITINMRNSVETSLRKAVATAIRNRYGSSPVASGEVLKLQEQLRSEIVKSVSEGYIDRAGRIWQPHTYAKVVAETVVMDAFNESTINEGVQKGITLARIVGPAPKDACGNWIGKIVSIDPVGETGYPSYDYAKSTGEVFHPHCRHRLRLMTEEV